MLAVFTATPRPPSPSTDDHENTCGPVLVLSRSVFDNDGTLWTELPVYAQLAFALDRAAELGHRTRLETLRAADGSVCHRTG
jgi:hypothetical protein